MDKDLPHNGEIWRHFKNKLYRIVAIAQHTETDESWWFIRLCTAVRAFMRNATHKHHLKGPRKRTVEDDEKFTQAFEQLLDKVIDFQ